MSTPRNPAQTASWLQRVAALFVDWVASSLAAAYIVGGFGESAYNWVTLGVFWAESVLGIALAGGSFGHLVLRLRVFRLDGQPVNLLQAMLRQALVLLVIPPLVYKADGRGLHDLAVNSGVFPLRPPAGA